MKNMKIVFYSPYIPKHFGGGEKYLFDTALVYATKHRVYIALPAQCRGQDLEQIQKEYEQHLGVDLAQLRFIVSPLGQSGHKWRKAWWTASFDVVYYVTDGSAFYSLARRRSIMHIQVPLVLERKTGWEKMKFRSFKVINSNSNFTKKTVEKYWGIKVNMVCQPGVRTQELAQPNVSKQKMILHVGRFFDTLHTKNQDVLVEFWRELITKHPEETAGWKLVLAGTVESDAYLARVREAARGLPVEILTNISREQLVKLYAQAAIYWHATGFHDQEWRHPERMEHFGISTVEAMAAGSVPIVIGKGGQKEILGQKLRECAWETKGECLRLTLRVMKNEQLRQKWSEQAVKRAQNYDMKHFARRCWQMLESKKI